MLRAPVDGEVDDESTAVGSPSDFGVDIRDMRDPHDAITAVSDEPVADSVVTVAEAISAAEPPRGEGAALHAADDDVIAAQFGALPTFSSEPASADDVAPAGSRPSGLGKLLGSPKRMAAVFGGVLAVVAVLVFVLGRDKQSASSAGPEAEAKGEVAKADTHVPDEPPAEPVEQGSAEAAAPVEKGSADAELVEMAGDETGSAAAAGTDSGSAVEKPVENAVEKPVEKVVKKPPAKRVAAKPAAKPSTAVKAPAKKPAAKTATKTTKPAVQKPGAKKPNWDPNSLFPQKKK